MATRLKNVDEIVSANNTKTTVLDYTPVVVTPASGVAAIDLSAGNNFSVAASAAITLSFSNMSGREGQSGNIWLTGGSNGISTDTMIKAAGEITADHWISYYVVSSTEVVISVSGEVA
jgi:hypothetical protein